MADTDDIAPLEEAPAAEAIIDGRFAVDLAFPLPQFDTAGATAFAARDMVDRHRKVLCLVQRPGVPRRDNVVAKLMGRNIPGLTCLRAEGIITANDRDGQGQRLVTIIDAPASRMIDNPLNFPPVPERIIKEVIAPQLAEAVAQLDSLGIAHRSISLTSLYYRDRERRELMLGECFSAPPAYHQSPIYEPVERALADPAGRGPGDLTCDMYALGVTLMSLFLGRDVGIDGDNVLRFENRLRLGSYWALGGSNELSGSMGDLLRGLLEDNDAKRWTPEDVKRWADGLIGRRTVSDPGWLLARPTVFRDKPYKDRRHLAAAFLQAPRDAIAFARSDRFRHWIGGALAEGPTEDWLDRALDSRTFGQDDDLTLVEEHMAMARLMAVFFPEGPICFGSLRFCADGFGAVLAMAQADNDQERLGLLRDLFAKSRFTMLLDLLATRCPALKGSLTKLLAAVPWMTSNMLGHGLERCLYEANKTLPCLSGKVRGTYVDTPKKLLLALDAAAARGDVGGGVIDNHVAAYLVSHAASFEGAVARLANVSLRPESHLTEAIRVLGLMQQKFLPQPLRNLTRALAPLLKKQVDLLKGSTRRKQVAATLNALVEDGNLMRLATDLNLVAMRQRDDREFQMAQQQYLAVSREQKRLQIPIGATDLRIRAEGYRFMCYLSYGVVVIVAVTSFFQALS